MSDAPHKAVRDPESYRESLDAWMKRQRPDAEGLRVHDVDMPRSTGFSNETVFFRATWQTPGGEASARYVARIEPQDGGLFPVQTPACAVSVQLQHRIMSVVAEAGAAPVPPLLPYEGDPSVLGSPFFVMEFVTGEIPADVPRYSQTGFLAETSSPEERERLIRSGIDAMAGLHAIDLGKAELDWLDPTGGSPTMAAQLDLYRRYVEGELAGREHPVLLKTLDWLDRNRPSAEAGLSWGDARIGNMIWQDHRCAAVVDWEAAALAPPEADIGWWVMFDRQSFDDMDAPRLLGRDPSSH
ncbi:MAG: phosphotransferase family protein [Planctomycetota bacterium]